MWTGENSSESRAFNLLSFYWGIKTLRGLDTSGRSFQQLLQGKLPVLLSAYQFPSEKGAILSGENLLPWEHCFPFRLEPFWDDIKRILTELPPLKVYPCPLIEVLTLWPLTFTTLWAYLADNKVILFFLFFQRKQALTFHANCLSLFSRKNKKNISMSSAEIFTQSA